MYLNIILMLLNEIVLFIVKIVVFLFARLAKTFNFFLQFNFERERTLILISGICLELF